MKISVSIILTVILLPAGQFAFAENVKDVNIVNTPAVTVINLPESQTVDGTVDIGNLPATQSVLVENEVTNPVPTEITNLEPIPVEVIGGISNGQNGGNLGPKKVSDLVTLMGIDTTCDGVALRRIFPDATVEESWRVPADLVLVGTGFDWGGVNGTPGEIVEILVFVFDPSVSRAEAAFLDYAQVGDNGKVGHSAPVQNVTWGPGTLVCVSMRGAVFSDARLRGFLAASE